MHGANVKAEKHNLLCVKFIFSLFSVNQNVLVMDVLIAGKVRENLVSTNLNYSIKIKMPHIS
jgi:hypothetical protein